MTMMVAGNLQADEAQCRSVLRDCDAAAQSLTKENELQKQIISDQNKRYEAQADQVKSNS
jgi:hypothetical protein